MDFLNLNTDPTLGGDNPSDTEISSQKAVKNYIDSHSSSDPNEIPAGTIYEGKFSELPAFFESLEGKYCNGIVYYHITEDEVIDTPINCDIPYFNFKVVIQSDNDEVDRTITLNTPDVDASITFTGGYYNQEIRLRHINIISTTSRCINNNSFITFSLYFCKLTTTTYKEAYVASNGYTYITSSEIITTATTSGSVAGVQINNRAVAIIAYSSFDKFYWGITSLDGGWLKSISNTFTNCNYSVRSARGSFAINRIATGNPSVTTETGSSICNYIG